MSTEPIIDLALSEADFTRLGKLTAAWSQTDHLLLIAIAKMLDITVRDCELLFDTSPAGARINAFKKLAKKLVNNEAKELGREFLSKIDVVLGKRNHLMHGIWGSFAAEGGQPCAPACYHPANNKGLIAASELDEIADLAISLANILAKFVALQQPLDFQNRSGCKLYFGYGSPEGKYDGDVGSFYMDLEGLGHSSD